MIDKLRERLVKNSEQFEEWHYLPAFRILPIKVQTIETILFDEFDGFGDESGPGWWTIDQFAIFSTGGVVPSTQSNQNLDAAATQSCYFGVEIRSVFVRIWPAVEDFHE